jgi:DNA-binding transcriptional LysR family regulator
VEARPRVVDHGEYLKPLGLRQLRDEAQLQKGLVTVVAMPTFAYMLLPQLMCRFAELYPNVEVRLLDFDSPRALEMLQQGYADLAVLARTRDLEAFEFIHLLFNVTRK